MFMQAEGKTEIGPESMGWPDLEPRRAAGSDGLIATAFRDGGDGHWVVHPETHPSDRRGAIAGYFMRREESVWISNEVTGPSTVGAS
ncbi:hypothetical protein ACMFMF_006011 [Clarireedia jacksonii]